MTKQAEEVLDETTDGVEVVSHLDLASYAHDDPFPDWHDSKPFKPMFRALLLGELEDASDAVVHQMLDEEPDVAASWQRSESEHSHVRVATDSKRFRRESRRVDGRFGCLPPNI